MPLEKELARFEEQLPELASQQGKFALVHGDDPIQVFTSYEDAVSAGYGKYKLEPFLVKQIMTVEKVQYVSRLSAPIPAT